MNYSLTERHMILADYTRRAHRMRTSTLEKSIARTWSGDYQKPEHLDFLSAISGDDLARLARGPQ